MNETFPPECGIVFDSAIRDILYWLYIDCIGNVMNETFLPCIDSPIHEILC